MYLYSLFEPYLSKWQLVVDGDPILTAGSQLLPVRHHGEPAMLKIAKHAEEQRGGLLMVWWAGAGVACVLQHDTNAILLERAVGKKSLVQMVGQGHDEEASRIICAVAAILHTPRPKPLPDLMPLIPWFSVLESASDRLGGPFADACTAARQLLAEPQEVTALHGDLHHGNIVDAENRGWLAIDPKGLMGERGFDFANLFCNPTQATATQPGRLASQSFIVAEVAGLDRKRLLQWIFAYAGLSAAWSLEDGDDPETALLVASLVAHELTQ